MGNIPTVPGTEFVQTPANRPKANVGAFLAPSRGMEAMARGLGDLGQVGSELAAKMQEARDSVAISNADLIMRQARDDQLAYMAKNPSAYHDWSTQWEKAANVVHDKIFNGPDSGRMSPVVRRKLEQALPVWSEGVNGEVRLASLKAELGDHRATIELDATTNAQAGDLAGAEAVWNSPGAKRVFTEAERKVGLDKIGGIADRASATNAVLTDPRKAMAALTDKTPSGLYRNFKHLTEEQRYSLTSEAKARTNYLQMQGLEKLVDQVESDPMNPPTEAQIEQAVKSGTITAKGAINLRNLIKKSQLNEARDKALVLDMQVHDHDFTTDKNPEQSAREFRDEAASLPIALQRPIANVISERLQAAKKKQAADPTGSRVSFIRGMDREDRQNGMFFPAAAVQTAAGARWFWPFGKFAYESKKPASMTAVRKMTDEKVAELYGAGMTSKKLLEIEQLNYARYADQMRRIEKAHPDWTDQQLLQARRELLAGHVAEHVAASLGIPTAETPPHAALSEQDQEALQWANAHVDDPRATEILSRIIAKSRR